MLSWVDYDKWQQPFSRKKNICSRTTKGAPSQFNWTFEEKYGWVYPYSKNSDDQSCFRWMLQIQPARGSKGKSTNDTMFQCFTTAAESEIDGSGWIAVMLGWIGSLPELWWPNPTLTGTTHNTTCPEMKWNEKTRSDLPDPALPSWFNIMIWKEY